MKISIGQIKKLIIHYVGNKSRGEGVKFSQIETSFDNVENDILQQVKNSFNFNQFYEFNHLHDIGLNFLYSLSEILFSDKQRMIEVTQSIASYLYDQSTHAKIKSGELYLIYFSDCIIEDEIVDALGIFKSENKDSFLKVNAIPDGFEIESLQGINIDKLDKGCIIFNTNKENGYLVSIVDNTNKNNEAQYWVNDFLHVELRRDEFYNTQNVMSLCKKFITEELPEKFNISKPEQADFMNKSIEFFKKENVFNIDNFSDKVIDDPEIIESFRSYKASYEDEQGVAISENFSISEVATKKQSKNHLE